MQGLGTLGLDARDREPSSFVNTFPAPDQMPSNHAPYDTSVQYGPAEDTPSSHGNRPLELITPASANKSTLAKDILRALNKVPEKRKASTPESSASDVDMELPPTKRPVIEHLPANIPMVAAEIFMVSPDLHAMEDAGDWLGLRK